MSQDELRQRLCAILLDKVARDPFPSTTIMDHIERSMSGPVRDAYVSVLLSKIESEQIPSPDLLNRVSLLLQR